MQQQSTYVLVVGGSLVGSSAALFLAARGVPTILVERHAGSSPHPRAPILTASMHKRRPIQSFRSARRRLVCTRLTGISVCFLSSIRNWKLDLNHGITSLIRWMFTR